MNIGIISPFNPASVKDFLYEKDANVAPTLSIGSTSITSIVRGLLETGNKVKVFTLGYIDKNHDTQIYNGENLEIYVSSDYKPFKGAKRIERIWIGRRITKVIKKNINNLDVLHAHWTYEYADACLPFVKVRPCFCTVDDWYPYIKTVYNKNFTQWFKWTIVSGIVFKRVMHTYPQLHFIPNSPYIKEKLSAYFKSNKFDIIPNAILHEVIVKERKFYPNHPLILSISMYLTDPRKNNEKLLEAFKIFRKKHHNAELLMVGTYNQTDETYIKWKNNGWLDGVQLKGTLPYEEIFRLLDNVSVLVHPSLEESFGGILIEAMARRVPVVGGKHSGAVPYVLEYGKIGCLCDVSSANNLSEALEKVVFNKIYSHRLIDNATEILLKKYSNIENAKMQVEYYKKFIKV